MASGWKRPLLADKMRRVSLFSQMFSINSVSGTRSKRALTVHGLVYAFGSSIVIWISRCPKSRRVNFSVTRMASV